METLRRSIWIWLARLIQNVQEAERPSEGFYIRSGITVILKFLLHYLFTINMYSVTAIMLSIIYIEICHRLGVSIMGSRVRKDFLIWPRTENLKVSFLHLFLRVSFLHSVLWRWLFETKQHLFLFYHSNFLLHQYFCDFRSIICLCFMFSFHRVFSPICLMQ